MKNSERIELTTSLVQTAREFQKAALRYKRKDLSERLVSETRGMRDGVMFAARQVYGWNTQAYFRNLARRAA